MDFSQDHFALFGLPAAFALDTERLERAYRDLQAQVHPDRFAHAGEADQRVSMQWATRVNEAYQTLRKPFERARYLLQLHGVDALDPRDTSMPADFLIRQMQWREALADAAGDAGALARLEDEIRAHAGELRDELVSLIDHRQDWAGAAATLRKLRFMDKLLEQIEAAYES